LSSSANCCRSSATARRWWPSPRREPSAPYPAYAAVGASKGALESLARHLAVELAPRGIRVNILSPGSVETEAWDAFPDKEQRLAEAARRAPIGRTVTLEEVACAAQFLCSTAARGIVGHTLVVDGGARIVD
jgi:enoyl-[acyl-carrier protein] reductase III